MKTLELKDLVIGNAYEFTNSGYPSSNQFIFNGIGKGIPNHPFWVPFLSDDRAAISINKEQQFVRDLESGKEPEQFILVEDYKGKKYCLFSSTVTKITELYGSVYLDWDIRHKVEAEKIISNLNKYSCTFGKNAITTEDYIRFEKYAKIDTSVFNYQLGKIYRIQENREIKIVARTYLKNYECVLGSDGIYRYDRSVDKTDAGRVCGSNIEYFDPKNILREDLGNRYEIIKDFTVNHFGNASDDNMKIINCIGTSYPRRIIDLSYKHYLQMNNLSPIGLL